MGNRMRIRAGCGVGNRRRKKEAQSHNLNVIPAQAGTQVTVVIPGPVSWVPTPFSNGAGSASG
jgi:hypothetical protein